MLTGKDYCDKDLSATLMKMGFMGFGYFYYEKDSSKLKATHQSLTVRTAKALGHTLAISLYEAQKWLREEKGIFSDIGLFNDGAFYYCIRQKKNNYWAEIYRSFFHDDLFDDYGKFESYEEALSEGIKAAINILKENETIHV